MKRYIILLVSLLCLFLLVGNCSFANSLTLTGFENYSYNGNILDFFNQILKGATGYNFEDEDIPISNWDTEKWTTFLNNLTSDEFQYFSFDLRKRTGSSYNHTANREYNAIYIQYFKNTNSNGGYQGEIYLAYNNGNPYINMGQILNYTSSGIAINSNFLSITKSKFAINKNNSNITSNQKWYKATANTIDIASSLKYISNKTQLINVNNNGVTGSMYKADYNLNGYINIGYLTSYKNYNQLNGYLGVFSGQSNVDNANYYDTVATFQYNKSNNTQLKNNLRLDYDTGQIYINSSVLAYNHAYSLYFTGNGEDTTTVVNYYFVPYGSSATSGDINTDNPTGLDFDFINSIEYIVNNNNSGNTEYIINNEFVNSSGDLFGIVYNDRDNWGFGDFVGSTINNIYNALFNYDNVTMDFGFLGQHSSSELTTPSDNALINIAGLFCNSFLLIGAVAWFWRSILAVSTLSVDKFIKDDEDLILF